MAKYPSPLKAIHSHCLDCCLNQPTEVRHCEATSCPVHPLRFGKKAQGFNVLKTIHEHCVHCGGGEEAPKDCEVTGCDLFPFRTGKNPNRRGIGNSANLKDSPTETRIHIPEGGIQPDIHMERGSSSNLHSSGGKRGLKLTVEVVK